MSELGEWLMAIMKESATGHAAGFRLVSEDVYVARRANIDRILLPLPEVEQQWRTEYKEFVAESIKSGVIRRVR